MSTFVDPTLKGGGLVKLQVTHLGKEQIRSNLKSSLFGETGDKEHHTLNVLALAANVSASSLTQTDSRGNAQWLFRILGKEGVEDPQDEDDPDDIEDFVLRFTRNILGDVLPVEYQYDNFFLGKRPDANAPGGVLNNGYVPALPENQFIMYVPKIYSFVDFLYRLNRKVKRINDVLNAVGWEKELGNLGGDIAGKAGGVGTPNPEQTIIPDPPNFDADLPDDLLELIVTPSGELGFRGSDIFWDSFAIQISPYFRELTGWPEILIFNDDQFGIEHGISAEIGEFPFTDFRIYFANTANSDGVTLETLSTKSLYQRCEERQEVLIKSDIPVGFERQILNGVESMRTIFGHFDLKHATQYQTTRFTDNFLISDDWKIQGNVICGLEIMDSPLQTGHVYNVLPSTIPSINFFALLRRRVYNFEKNEYEEVEVPLLQNSEDMLIINLIFALQK